MGFFWITNSVSRAETPPPLDSILQPILAKYRLPGMAAAIFTTDGVTEMAAVGVRKIGSPEKVTMNDLWHLGSDPKMMTATLAGTFVDEKKLSWDSKVISFFPEFAGAAPDAVRDVTVGEVLRHRAGMIENLDWDSFAKMGSLSEQRLAAAKMGRTNPAYPRGSFHYSNTDYVIIGVILEKIGGKPWEELMRERLFKPLGMSSAGFGGMGTIGQIDQPWPHAATGVPAPLNGPTMDNPPVMGPAGTCHASLKDWTAFLIDQLRGGSGMKALLPGDIYRTMQTPGPKTDYADGWGVLDRSLAGGPALTHAGSNTVNYCVCWLAPKRNSASRSARIRVETRQSRPAMKSPPP